MTLREFFDGLPDEFRDALCSGVAIILATADAPHVARTMTEGQFIQLCQIVTGGRAVDVRHIQ